MILIFIFFQIRITLFSWLNYYGIDFFLIIYLFTKLVIPPLYYVVKYKMASNDYIFTTCNTEWDLRDKLIIHVAELNPNFGRLSYAAALLFSKNNYKNRCL